MNVRVLDNKRSLSTGTSDALKRIDGEGHGRGGLRV
jgi:hypothetical protein